MAEDDFEVYGFDIGLALISICGFCQHNGITYLWAMWEGSAMPQPVPAVVLGDKYPLEVLEYMESKLN